MLQELGQGCGCLVLVLAIGGIIQLITPAPPIPPPDPRSWVHDAYPPAHVNWQNSAQGLVPGTAVAIGRTGEILYEIMRRLPYRVVPPRPEQAAVLVRVVPVGPPRPFEEYLYASPGTIPVPGMTNHPVAVDWELRAGDRTTGKVLAKYKIISSGKPLESPYPPYQRCGLGDVDNAIVAASWVRTLPFLGPRDAAKPAKPGPGRP